MATLLPPVCRMPFYDHVTEYCGKHVVEYDPDRSLAEQSSALTDVAFKLAVEYDSDSSAADLLARMVEDPDAAQVTSLVIGPWIGQLTDGSVSEIVEPLVAAAGRLSGLRELFIGDITYEECEVSWIVQGDISPIWEAFPNLVEFRIRGTNGLSLGNVAHSALERLIIEGGGLGVEILHQLTNSRLPSLTHLELYLGDEEYGWSGTIGDVRALINPARFPRLKYLGLRNSIITDELAELVAGAEITDQLEVLDLSLGTLSDEGAQHLLTSPRIAKLKELRLAHHYLTARMFNRLSDLPIQVDMTDPQDIGDSRYCAIGE